MAISEQVRSQLFQQASACKMQAIRIPTTRGGATRGGLVPRSPGSGRGLWTPEEHLRFLEALDKFPAGPWKSIAQYVGNKTPRQAMTHGQKYRQKIARRRRGLKKIVRDLQFAAVDQEQQEADNEDPTARLSVESNPMGLSDQDFAAFVASLDLAEELQTEYLSSPDSDSPLVVAATPTHEDELPCFSLDALEAETAQPPVTNDCRLPLTTVHQDVHHWVVMDRADASSEEFSVALALAFHGGNVAAEELACAKPLPMPEQLLDDYCQQQMELEPLVLEPTLDALENLEFDGFELR
ncbi:hypothetical protein PRIC2_001338 [Phytophthora ramorum]